MQNNSKEIINSSAQTSNSAESVNIDELIDAFLLDLGISHERTLIKRLMLTTTGLATDKTNRLNLKIASAALSEMREAYQLFEPYSGVPKVTVFGSARTADHDPLWLLAHQVARGLARDGWMVVTGAGPGIMEAATVGAGTELAIGVSIRLPFEEKPNTMIFNDDRLVAMKYFFTRKLMLVKESMGFISLPGGFGTLDEVYELLTLQQTGKMVPVPIVLLDKPGGSYWSHFKDFIVAELEAQGYVTKGDMDRVFITDSVEAAVTEVTNFWANYASIRWFGDRLVMRVKKAPNDNQLLTLNQKFKHLVLRGEIERTGAFEQEIKEGDALDLERITFIPDQRQIGDLHRIIRVLNKMFS